MTDIYTANSKEVLRNGVHFADAVDDDAAQVIVSAMSELHGLRVQIEVHEKLGPARERQFAKCRDERDTQRAGIIAHLEADATRRPRARAFTRGMRHAIDEIRNRFDEVDEDKAQ
jgi:hypothetical protein